MTYGPTDFDSARTSNILIHKKTLDGEPVLVSHFYPRLYPASYTTLPDPALSEYENVLKAAKELSEEHRVPGKYYVTQLDADTYFLVSVPNVEKAPPDVLGKFSSRGKINYRPTRQNWRARR